MNTLFPEPPEPSHDEVLDIIIQQAKNYKLNMAQNQQECIHAITNLDAEDLGSSILRTYTTSEEAHKELELMEAGTHEEFFSGGVHEVFAIDLPAAIIEKLKTADSLEEENGKLMVLVHEIRTIARQSKRSLDIDTILNRIKAFNNEQSNGDQG